MSKKIDLDPALRLVKEFEGCRLKAYKDPVGVWTIGYGTTIDVFPGMKITQEQAEKLLVDDINRIRVPALQKAIKVPITNNEACALISFAYNVGNGALVKSTLVKKLNAGRPLVEVADEFLKWTKAGGRILSGLVRRRKAERALFLKREIVNFVA